MAELGLPHLYVEASCMPFVEWRKRYVPPARRRQTRVSRTVSANSRMSLRTRAHSPSDFWLLCHGAATTLRGVLFAPDVYGLDARVLKLLTTLPAS